MALKTTTKTGSTERVIRTFFQALVAAVPAIPILDHTLHLSSTTSAEVVGIAGLVVVVISAVQNGLETLGWLPAMLRGVPNLTVTPAEVAAAEKVAPSVVTAVQEATAAVPTVAGVVSAAEHPAQASYPQG